MSSKNYFQLYSHIVPVLGTNRSVFFDLQNFGYSSLPCFLYEIFTEFNFESIPAIANAYKDHNGEIEKYCQFLDKKGYGTFTNHPACYPKVSLEWYRPNPILSAVIEINLHKEHYDFNDVIQQLIRLQCFYLEIRIIGECSNGFLETMLEGLSETSLRSIDIILCYSSSLTDALLLKLYKQFMKLHSIIVYKAPADISMPDSNVFFLKNDINNKDGVFTSIRKDQFIIHLFFFSECQKHHPFFNRKVCIDQYGAIKNSLDFKKMFGSVNSYPLSRVIEDTDFTELWFVSPDRILDTKDWEFRYAWLNTHELEKVDNYYYKIKK